MYQRYLKLCVTRFINTGENLQLLLSNINKDESETQWLNWRQRLKDYIEESRKTLDFTTTVIIDPIIFKWFQAHSGDKQKT